MEKATNEKAPQKMIKVVLLEPGKLARIAEIGHSLEQLQAAVGGDIEAIYPFEEEVCIVYNDEGKINGLPLNRAVYSESGELVDIIAGPCFLCDCSGESFGSLNDEQLARYQKQFRLPEYFFRSPLGIAAVPYVPAV